ncbi:MAG TPA: DUF885 domain-containing protein [Hyphomonas sp.]|nr:DUF885 domain-containing protein [Hyphomonas sp.]HRJ01567.1 DUF885 domain-containing protein [Hyphomonas sp.]
MKLGILAACILAAAPAAAADPLDPLIAAYQAYIEAGDPGEAARSAGAAPRTWGSVRLPDINARADQARALLAEIEASDSQRAVDIAILERLLKEDIISAELDMARIPFTGDWGFQAAPVFAAIRARLKSVDDAEAWVQRLDDVPRYFAENRINMARGITTGWTSHRDPLATTRDQIQAQIIDDPAKSDLYQPFLSLPDSIPAAEAERLRTEGLAATARAIQAYRDTARFIDLTYAPAVRKGAGIAALPGGHEVYAATVDAHTAGAGYGPEEIHALGLSEVARIRAEMQGVMAETGFDGTFAEFLNFLRTDPQFYAETDLELMAKAREITSRIDVILPLYFHTLPKLGYTVDPVPMSIAPGYTTGRYVQGDIEEGRKGSYLVNTYALEQRPLYELPALSAHEAVPGHHLQIALAQEMADQPRFRQEYYATAFGEGWGLYSERIAGEAGIYETPYERFGALSYEMWRACRLVADTGLHWYGWTREEAEACFKENSALSPLNIETEVTRYIGWPGQATAYKIGELKIRALRAEAEAALGDKFDIRDFHGVVLGQGAVPLDVLDAQVKAWVADSAAR